MAQQVNNHHTVKIIEQCQVAPPHGSVPSTSLPLAFFDIPWFYCCPAQRIFFYEFPHPTRHFLQTVLPNLKQSLSLTLRHFFPFAANLIVPPQPHIPYIRYLEGDSLSFTVAETAADFTLLISDSPQDVRDWHPFVPALPPPCTVEDGTRLIPLMAIQVTVLSNSGFSICVTFNHLAADGRAFHHFMKFWASVCKARGDVACLEGSLPLPFHDRSIVEDPKGLKLIYLKELTHLTNTASESMEFAGHVPEVFPEKVRATLVLSLDRVEKLKKWVSLKFTGSETLHISTFVVTCSLIWVCMVTSEQSKGDYVTKDYDELCFLVFLADCRNHPEFSLPSTYFGNCVVSSTAAVKRNELAGENGIVVAANAIERRVRDLKSDPLRGAETLMTNYRELAKPGQPVMLISGSPKLGVYETDFGWGKPKKSEVVHLDSTGSVSLSDCRDKEGGIEVGLGLERIRMNNFIHIFEERIGDMMVCD